MKVTSAIFFAACIVIFPVQPGERNETNPSKRWWNWKGFFLRSSVQCQARCVRKHGWYWSSMDEEPQHAAVGAVRFKGFKCWCSVPQELLGLIEATYGKKMAQKYKYMNKFGFTARVRKEIMQKAETSTETLFPVFMSDAELQEKMHEMEHQAPQTLEKQESGSEHSKQELRSRSVSSESVLHKNEPDDSEKEPNVHKSETVSSTVAADATASVKKFSLKIYFSNKDGFTYLSEEFPVRRHGNTPMQPISGVLGNLD